MIAVPVNSAKDGLQVGMLAVACSLEQRQATVISAIYTQLAFASGLLLALVTLLLFIVDRTVARPVRAVNDVIDALARGDTSLEIGDSGRGDEIGDMMRSLTSLGVAVGDAFRLQQMVEQMPVSIMTCGTDDFLVNYANQASLDMYAAIEQGLSAADGELVG